MRASARIHGNGLHRKKIFRRPFPVSYAYPRQSPVRSLLKSDGGSDGSGGKEEEQGKGRPPGGLSMGREGNLPSRRAPCRKPQISV